MANAVFSSAGYPDLPETAAGRDNICCSNAVECALREIQLSVKNIASRI